MRAIRFEEENLPIIAEFFDTADMMRIKKKFNQRARNHFDFLILEATSVVLDEMVASYYYVSLSQLQKHYDYGLILATTKWFDVRYK